jgi:hypothetical protein
MTVSQAITELERAPRRFDSLSRTFFASFLDVDRVPASKIASQEESIKRFSALLLDQLFMSSVAQSVKNDLVDLIEELQLALDVLAIRSGKTSVESNAKAGRHLAKKMQSSFSDPVPHLPTTPRLGNVTVGPDFHVNRTKVRHVKNTGSATRPKHSKKIGV